jgi:hypothetical protein
MQRLEVHVRRHARVVLQIAPRLQAAGQRRCRIIAATP